MKLATFRFDCLLTSKASFSSYKGSMLRGSLGTFLRKTSCVQHRTTCENCLLAARCPFILLFTGRPAEKGDPARTLPPPYCLIPSDTGKTLYEAGERFSFGLTLFSSAVSYLPYFIHAFLLAGERGMGRQDEETRGTFTLEDVRYKDRSIYSRERQQAEIPEGEELSLPVWDPSLSQQGTLLVHLLTPCRFKADNRLSAGMSFRTLVNLIVRRLRSLWALEGTDVRFDNFSEMLDRADSVRTVESSLVWRDWTRYSSRQKAAMQLGGLQGDVRCHGDILSFVPFFELAERISIGKQTSFGLGQLRFLWVPDRPID